ncbi:MAG: type IV secretion system DNA-binding domain-containing protein [Candidatus Nealsonbacteria bacterium]|nr:type IV secretion system DNA-binding domain-containing protein [Candidatus Nealsonbacteria bacterium]
MDKNSVNNEINFFGLTTFRNQRKKFGIKTDDRRRHVYVIGKTGMGKTEMLKNMVIQDIQKGNGIGFVDPHGEAAEELLDFIPSNRVNDVVYFNPADLDYPIAFNIMEKVDLEHRHLVASGLMGVFKKIWPDVWSARMEYILNNSILALLEYPGSTLLGINRMLANPEYRKKIVDKVTDPVVKSFWIQEFARYTQRYEVEATAAIQNKVGQFISNPLIRNIIGQVKSNIDMRKIIDEKKILIMNISKGRIGEDNSRLLGALLITKLQLAAMSRVDVPEEKREDFFLYVDEFQNFATKAFVNILSEARKYRLCLTLGNQYIAQLEEMTPTGRSADVRDAIFGNVGTIVVFRVGAEDAEFLEKEFAPEFTAGDLVNLPKYNIDLKLMIDGVAGSAFSAETLPPFPKSEESNREKIIKASRERYSVLKKIVEEKITKWLGALKSPEVPLQEFRQVLYDAKCSLCGKWTKVTFEPDASRPVYCKTCLKKVRPAAARVSEAEVENEKRDFSEKKKTSSTFSLQEAVGREPISFFGKREVKKTKEEKKTKRKEVNLEELKKTLEESLKGIETKKDENNQGV